MLSQVGGYLGCILSESGNYCVEKSGRSPNAGNRDDDAAFTREHLGDTVRASHMQRRSANAASRLPRRRFIFCHTRRVRRRLKDGSQSERRPQETTATFCGLEDHALLLRFGR